MILFIQVIPTNHYDSEESHRYTPSKLFVKIKDTSDDSTWEGMTNIYRLGQVSSLFLTKWHITVSEKPFSARNNLAVLWLW